MQSVIQVIGTTGVGKSQLGIELAKALHGEIINSDSMQVYAGLDIITNKHPMDKRDGVPHHLLGFLDHRDAYTIGAYEKDAGGIVRARSHRFPWTTQKRCACENREERGD